MTGFRVARLPRGLLKIMTRKAKSGGAYVKGIWVEGTTANEVFMGILLPLAEDDLKFQDGNLYTTKDHKLYCEEDFADNSIIVDNLGDSWNIKRARDYRDLGTFRRYFAKKEGVASE